MKCSKTSWLWANTGRWHGTPHQHWRWKLNTGFHATWILCFSTLSPDSGTLIYKGNARFTLIREHNFWRLSSSPVLFVLSPGETLLTLSSCSRVAWHKESNSWIPCLSWVSSWWLLKRWLQLQSTLCESPPYSWMGFVSQFSPRCGYPYSLYTFFLPHFFRPFTCLLMCLDSKLCEQPSFLAITFCVLPSLCKMAMVVFWTTVKSEV